MIKFTRLNGEEIVINAGFIEFLEATPDTVVSLTTGRKVLVREPVDLVIQRVMEYEGAVSNAHRFGQRQGVMSKTVAVAEEDDS